MVARESNRPLPNRTGTFSCIRLSRHRVYLVSRSDTIGRGFDLLVRDDIEVRLVEEPIQIRVDPVRVRMALPQCFKPEQG